jgi:hypothetical protein
METERSNIMSFYEDGLAVDTAVKKYMEENPGVDYLKACNTVIKLANTDSVERKARAVKTYRNEHGTDATGFGWRIYENGNGEIIEAELANTGGNINRLADIVLGLPRLSDGKIDAGAAVQTINRNFPDISGSASGDFLNAVAQNITRDRNLGTERSYSDCLNQAQTEYPVVSAVYQGGTMTTAALQSMLWPLFQRSTQRYSRSGRVHRYSADGHVSYDTRGNHFRAYSFDR